MIEGDFDGYYEDLPVNAPGPVADTFCDATMKAFLSNLDWTKGI